jgi:hypothetical protein
LRPHRVEFLNIPPRPNQILGLDLTSSHLSILRTLLDLSNQLLLLILQLHSLTIKFSLGLLERSLVLAQTLGGGHALSERPFDDLGYGD